MVAPAMAPRSRIWAVLMPRTPYRPAVRVALQSGRLD
jgi:hypothetical protein